jgi:uncharacterized protein YegL
VVGFKTLQITGSSTAMWGTNSRLRVALVLDNTGSMADAGKMPALKIAAKNLLAKLQSSAASNADVYVSIIPFAKEVNVGASNYTQSWLRWDLWAAAGGGTNHNTWNGCVTDRDQNYDTLNTTPTNGAKFPAEQYSSCPAQVMGLSYDWAGLNSKIDAMTPKGNTNQAIGLAWGWQSLTNAPLTVPVKDPNYQYQDIIILLTDGLNTQDRWYTNASSIDTRQQITCNNINAAGITLYTVQVNTDGDPTSTLLQHCAGSPGKYPDANKFFLLTSANQIITTFSTIGTSLQKLYLAK